jgi:hypothetical protein
MWRLLAAGNAPPYQMDRKQRRWRYDYLIAFRNKTTELRGEVLEYPDLKTAATADAPKRVIAWSVEAVAEAVSNWKDRELWTRAQDVMSYRAFHLDATKAFMSERELVDPPLTEQDDALWHNMILAKTIEIATSIGFDLSAPPETSEERDARMTLKHLLIHHYSDVLASEAKWRAMDWSSMPKGPPRS